MKRYVQKNQALVHIDQVSFDFKTCDNKVGSIPLITSMKVCLVLGLTCVGRAVGETSPATLVSQQVVS